MERSADGVEGKVPRVLGEGEEGEGDREGEGGEGGLQTSSLACSNEREKGRTSTAIPGTNIITASAWKNLRRMLRLACTRFSSLACSAPTLADSFPLLISLPLPLLAPFLIRILRARTSLVCQPPTATTIVPAQYATRTSRFQRCQPRIGTSETGTPSPP